jgi:outer membrane protein
VSNEEKTEETTMSRALPYVIAFLLISALTSTLSAETYTLDKCIEIALQNNYGVIAARNSFEATRWSLNSAYAEFLPSISISTDRNENWATTVQYIGGIPIFSSGKRISYGGGLSLGQSYQGLGLGTYANIKNKQAQRSYYFFGYLDAEKNLVLSVKEAYFNVTKAKMLEDVSGDAVKRSQEQLRVAQSKYELGSASLSDVLKSKVNYNNARLDQINAENGYNLAKANLNFTMGIDIRDTIEISEEFPEGAFDITYEQALSEALGRL